MSDVQKLAELVEAVWTRKDELKGFELLLKQACVALATLCKQLETPPPDILGPLIEKMGGLNFTLPAPSIDIHVAPAAVTVIQAERRGWTMSVTEWKPNGRIKTVSIQPEA